MSVPPLYTIGHSNRPIEELVALLQEHHIGVLADVRSYPGSKRWPHFNRESLEATLGQAGIDYVWMKGLGGRRKSSKQDSPNTALRSEGFRNYADYMQTESFGEAIAQVLETAQASPTAIMCAEKLFWQCHRRLISDHLTAQGVPVIHIIEAGKTQTHSLSPEAQPTEDGTVIYPSPLFS